MRIYKPIYKPIYHRPPNRFVEYELRKFDYSGFSGVERVAIFIDKKGRTQEMTAQIIWDIE